MSNSKRNLPAYDVFNVVKFRLIFLGLLLILSFTGMTQAKGYNWVFVTSQLDEWSNKYFEGEPATPNSPDNHPTLTTMNAGTFTENQTATVGLGSSCTSSTKVAEYSTDKGLEYLNPSQFITNTYTIEMVINISGGSKRRLIGFYNLSEGDGNKGVYVNSSGGIEFNNGTANNINTSPLSTSTWYHLAFVRKTNGDLLYYKNGTYVGTYADNSNHFIPHSGTNYNLITFLKDDGGDESAGKLAKVSIYDTAYGATEITTHFNAICEGSSPPSTGTVNYIPKFTGPTTFGNSIIYESGGSVGIGTTAIDSNYKLYVEKGIRTRTVKVDITNWPDYVFDKKYQLPSLHEIETFINKNKHLPGIPSATEAEQNGIELGDQQAMLLKKIEELTLYIININKQVDSINKQVDRLTEENKALKKRVTQLANGNKPVVDPK